MTLLRPKAILVLRVHEARAAMLAARDAWDRAAADDVDGITDTHTAYAIARDAYIEALELHFAAAVAADSGDIEAQMAVMLEIKRDVAGKTAANDPRSVVVEICEP